MKKAILVLAVFALIGFYSVPSWAGPAEETGLQWVERAMQQNPELFPEGMVPNANYLWYVDLMSNAPNWASYLIVTNWSLNTRIQFYTTFIPTNGTPSNIINKLIYIDPNKVVYLNANNLGFTSWGSTNWFGIVYAPGAPSWVSTGVLLYSSEFGLTWVPTDGPYTY